MIPDVSVIVPSRNSKFASRTVEDLFSKASGNIEVIILLDDYWPDPPIKPNPNLIIIHKGVVTGMRDSINRGVSIARGKYIMKCDDHCTFGEGFDEILSHDIEPNWLVVPSRYSLTENWEIKRQAIEYEYMAYPYKTKLCIGLYSKKWWGTNGDNPTDSGFNQFYYRERERKDILLDEIMIIQGSCWFTTKEHFNNIGGLFNYKSMYQEPQELTLKTWLSGGKCMVNKNTWYGHLYKSEKERAKGHPRGYILTVSEMRAIERYGTWYWMNDKWPKATRKIKWLIDHFWPIAGWPDNWEEEKIKYETKYGVCY